MVGFEQTLYNVSEGLGTLQVPVSVLNGSVEGGTLLVVANFDQSTTAEGMHAHNVCQLIAEYSSGYTVPYVLSFLQLMMILLSLVES